jgi:iron(III) transport system substrate-binding protein
LTTSRFAESLHVAASAGDRLALALLLVVAVVGVGCGRSEREVVVYTSHDQVFSEPILRDFEQRTGIRVRALYDTEETKSTGIALRLVAERDRPQADVFWANEPLRPVMLRQQGVLAPYRSPAADGIPARYRDPADHWTGFAARARVIVYNTTAIPASGAPRSVRDLTASRWKGRAGLANPLFGTTTTQIAALWTLWGESETKRFLAAAKANDVRIVSSNGEARDLVAAGELAWAFTDTDDASVALEHGKPVGVVYPDQDGIGTLVMPNAVALITGAPHPDEARRLVDYLLSPEVEARLAASAAAQMPLHSGVTVPPQVKPVSAIRDMPVTFAELGRTIDQILPLLREWVGGR